VVLDLDEVSEFDASLADNPPRLIIDIHNKPVTAAAAMTRSTADVENSSAKSIPDPASGEALSGEKVSIDKSAHRNSVVISNGVKKTIVDADSDGPEPAETPAQNSKKDAAKSDYVDPGKNQARQRRHSSGLPSERVKSSKSKRRPQPLSLTRAKPSRRPAVTVH